MRKHDREPNERRAPPAPSRAEQRRTGAAQGRRAGAAPPAHAPAPAAAGPLPTPPPPPPQPRSRWRSRGRTLRAMLSGGSAPRAPCRSRCRGRELGPRGAPRRGRAEPRAMCQAPPPPARPAPRALGPERGMAASKARLLFFSLPPARSLLRTRETGKSQVWNKAFPVASVT